MDVKTALSTRKSVRAYLKRPVERAVIEGLLDAARHAPSGANTQPWRVWVLSGERKARLGARLEQAFREGRRGAPDYAYYPREWFEPYQSRRRACGLQLYEALRIARDDRQRRADQWAANYRAFDAPVMLLFFVDRRLGAGSYLDYGMFLQSLMLAAVEQGLATCAQAALAEYPELVRDELGLDDELRLLCGMALGYEDRDAPINAYRTPREPVSEFTTFIDHTRRR